MKELWERKEWKEAREERKESKKTKEKIYFLIKQLNFKSMENGLLIEQDDAYTNELIDFLYGE